jgi:hypothetical protein
LLVDLDWQLHQVLCSHEGDGGDILRKLLQTLKQLASVPEDVACWMLQMSGPGEVPNKENSGWRRKQVVQAQEEGTAH